MSEANVRAITERTQVVPYLICSSALVPCRRPRLYWLSWQLQLAEPHSIVDRGFCLEVVAETGAAIDFDWEDAGWRWDGRPASFPTLACCRPLPSFP
eukprot:2753160-Pyramimonas_sp.AAC.2